MSGADIIGLVLEKLILLGFVSSGVCLVIWVLMRTSSSALLETTAILLPSDNRATVRWMAEDGRLYSRELDVHEHGELGDLESTTVYYSRRSPETIRFARRSEAERAVLLFFAITACIGVGSFAASLILLVVEEA